MKCEHCGRDGAVFSHAYECYLCADRGECEAYHEAAKEAQEAQDAADLEAGRAWRKLVATGREFSVDHGEGITEVWFYAPQVGNARAPTLAEAVTAALEGG